MTDWTDLCLEFNINILKDDVLKENQRQLTKWGIQTRSPFEWLTYLTEEVGELAQAVSEFEYRKGSVDDIYKEAIQVATLSLKIAEIVGVRR